jgi:hypothetical protein
MGKRPDLAGHLLEGEGQPPPIYLVDDDGTRRLIPNPPTYINLFGSYWNPDTNIDVNTIDQGPDISDGAILASDGVKAYLIDNYQKRWIRSPDVMNKFHFQGKVQNIAAIVLNCIADGPDIT